MPVEGRRRVRSAARTDEGMQGDAAQKKSPHSDIRSADFRVGRFFVPASYSIVRTTSPLERLGTLGVHPRLPGPVPGPLLMHGQHTNPNPCRQCRLRTPCGDPTSMLRVDQSCRRMQGNLPPPAVTSGGNHASPNRGRQCRPRTPCEETRPCMLQEDQCCRRMQGDVPRESRPA